MEANELPDDNQAQETGKEKISSSGKTREQIQAEIKALSDKSRQHAQGKIFGDQDIPSLDEDEEEDELGGFALRNIADRDESHKLYFGMYGIMKRNLPKGKANEPLRRFVYDEVLLYLNQGKRKDARGIRGSSGQMAYIPTILQPAWAIVMDWVAKGANPFDLYSVFEAQNIALGYHGGTGAAPASTASTPPTPITPVVPAAAATVEARSDDEKKS